MLSGGGRGGVETVEGTVGGASVKKSNAHFIQYLSLSCIGWTQRFQCSMEILSVVSILAIEAALPLFLIIVLTSIAYYMGYRHVSNRNYREFRIQLLALHSNYANFVILHLY